MYRVFTYSYHTLRQCVIKSIICGSHPMIIFIYKTNSFVLKPKAFWMLHLNNNLYIQNHDSFCGQRIFVVSPQASHAFLDFHRLPSLEICITTCTRSFTREGVYHCLLLSDTYFHFHVSNRVTLLDFIQQYRVHQSITNTVLIHIIYSHPCHAISPCIMQCDAPLHVYTMSHI